MWITQSYLQIHHICRGPERLTRERMIREVYTETYAIMFSEYVTQPWLLGQFFTVLCAVVVGVYKDSVSLEIFRSYFRNKSANTFRCCVTTVNVQNAPIRRVLLCLNYLTDFDHFLTPIRPYNGKLSCIMLFQLFAILRGRSGTICKRGKGRKSNFIL